MRTKIYIKTLWFFFLSVIFIMNANAQDNVDSLKIVEEETTIVKVGNVAPDFTVEMLDGSSLKLSDMKGKVVLVNFWATWCGTCMEEFKEIPEKIVKRFEDKEDFIFVPISRGENRATVQKKMNQLRRVGIVFPVGLDPDKKIYESYASLFIPRNFLIDREGKVVFNTVGHRGEEFAALADKIELLMAQ